MGAHQVCPRALELVERTGFRRGQDPSAASNAPACRLACAAASARSARRAGSTVSATARCRNAAAAATPAASLRSAGRAFELGSDLLVRARRRVGSVPGAPIWVCLGVGGLSEGAMHTLAVVAWQPCDTRRTERVG